MTHTLSHYNNPLNTLLKVAGALLLLVAIISVSGCGSDDEDMKETDRVQAILTDGAWNLQTVTVGGTDQTALYAGLQVTFTATGYTSVNGDAVWPATGTWQFTNESATVIKRNDDLVIDIAEILDNKLVLELTWTKTTLGSGRTASVAGEHTFTFVRP